MPRLLARALYDVEKLIGRRPLNFFFYRALVHDRGSVSAMPARKKESKKAGAGRPSKPDEPSTSVVTTDIVTLPVATLQDEAASSVPPVFTRDGSYVFLVQHCTVLIISRATNQVVATLSGEATVPAQRHRAPITGMLLSPFNPLQLLTCSLDGTIKTWDYLDSELHDDMNVGYPVCAMGANALWKHRLFVAVAKEGESGTSSSKRNTTIYSLQLGRASIQTHKAVKQVRLGKARDVTHLAVSPNGAWLVALSGSKVHLLSLHDTSAGFVKYSSESRLTALAFHPDADTPRFATGEANGKIKVWYCLEQFAALGRVPDGTDAAPTTTLHWHAHGVAALQYTPDGAQLLSGGEEGVLVLWKLSSGQAAGSDAREYVPRLGAGIVAVAVAHGFDNREQEYVARLADGSVAFVASLSLKLQRSFATVKCDATRALLDRDARAALPHPLALDAAAGHVVLTAGHPSTLQFVDVGSHVHIRDVEVAPSNRVSRPEDEALTPPRVQHVAFSHTPGAAHAEWMATVDGREGGAYTSELSLKLWQWDARRKTYVLNTRIDHPHEHSITALSFSPRAGDGLLLATAGAEGQIKTWRLTERTLKGARTETFWVCRSSLGYRGTTPRAIAWAPDGSLFAVAQGVFVTLWDPDTLVMQARLAAPELRAAEQCVFIGRKGRFLAALGAWRLLIWDLIGQNVVYTAPYAVKHIVAHRDGLLAAVDEADGTLLYFVQPQRRDAAAVYRAPRLLHGALLNVAPASEEVQLIGLGADGALLGLGAAAKKPAPVAHTLHGVALHDARATLFDELFGVEDAEHERVEAMLRADQERMTASAADASVGEALALFSAPAHLLPPVTTLLDAYVDALLPKAPVSVAEPIPVETPTTPLEAPMPALTTQDRIAEARDADLDHLAIAFDAMLPSAPAAAPLPKGKGGKRRVSKSM